MKDLRLVDLRLRAERDLALSDGAFRLLCRLVSEKYNSPVFFAEETFALAWTTVQRLCAISRRQAQRRIIDLCGNYLANDGIKGCPPVAQFHFLLKSAKNGAIEGVKKGAIKSVKKGPHHISNPFGKELLKEEGKNSSAQRRGETKGKEGIERRRTPKENGAKVRSMAKAMRKAAS